MTGTNIAMTGTIAGNLATRRFTTCESLEGTLLNVLHEGKLQHRAAAMDSSSVKLYAISTPHHYSSVAAQVGWQQHLSKLKSHKISIVNLLGFSEPEAT